MILTIENLTKSYGEKVLFENVSLGIDEGDKIGIVGVNGTGKSTFIRTVAGTVPADSGNIVTMKNIQQEYLEQDKIFLSENTVLMEVFKGNKPIMKALRDYEIALSDSKKYPENQDLQEKIMQLTQRIDELDGWQMESDAKTILTKLGISDFTAKAGELSGGQQKRLALATALIHPCDLLFLDEPTNHLDSETITWLEEYLRKIKGGALLLVTHDRYFLDCVATKILELDKGKAYVYTGNYTEFLELKAAREDRDEASERKRQNLLRNELAWMRRGAQARSTKQKARIERYEDTKNKKVDLSHDNVEIGLAGSRLGRTVIELEHVNYMADAQKLIDDFSYIVLRNDRVGILGPNGSGKTTLLNLLSGKLQPTSGTIKVGQTVKIGYFTQTSNDIDERLRAVEYIKEAAYYITLADGTRLSASQLMETFLFPSDLQWSPISKLSGGEKRRLFLLRILMDAPNVLLLDEPTNDLDLQTMAILEDFIDRFNGAIIFVSHDRFFVDRLAKKVFVYEEGGHLRQYPGGYSCYKAEQEREKEDHEAIQRETQPPEKMLLQQQGKNMQEELQMQRRLTFKEQREYEEIELVIASVEGELKVVQQQMTECAGTDYSRLSELSQEELRLQSKLETLMERWEYLEETSELQK
ncbi:MAG: ABC-F family ATP-binding cassette domain-containing protein [Selenomonadaceae bacterium]